MSCDRLKSKRHQSAGGELSTPSLTQKDRDDLEFGLSLNVNFVAQSFVRSKKDVEELRNILHEKRCDGFGRHRNRSLRYDHARGATNMMKIYRF